MVKMTLSSEICLVLDTVAQTLLPSDLEKPLR